MKALMDDYTELGTPDDKKEKKIDEKQRYPGLDKLIQTYEDYLSGKEELLESVDDILTPQQINHFLGFSRGYEFEPEYQKTASFLNVLIENSYHAGYNDFTLSSDGMLASLCTQQRETDKRNPLRVKVTGPAGNNFGSQSRHMHATLEDVGTSCGYHMRSSRLIINGNAGEDFGYNSMFSEFHITGNAGNTIGRQANRTIFRIDGNSGDVLGSASQDSVFIIKGKVGEYLVPDAVNAIVVLYDRARYEQGISPMTLRGACLVLADEDGIVEHKIIGNWSTKRKPKRWAL